MKFKNLLATAMLAIPAMASAIPAAPGLQTVKNPDGTTLQIYAYGDHNFHFYTDAEGLYILQPDSRGFWSTVERQGRSLRATPEDIALLRAEKATLPHAESTRDKVSRMAALDNKGRTTYQTIGEPHALVVLVQFADTKFRIPDIRQTITDFCNKEGYDGYGGVGSVRDYFIQQSGGKFKPIFDVSPVVTLKNNRAYYAEYSTVSNVETQWNVGQLIKECIDQLDEDIDFAKYDVDNDGAVDNIFFLYAGYSQADTHDKSCIWPHNGTYYNYVRYTGLDNLIPDGKRVLSYVACNELKNPNALPPLKYDPWLDGIGTITHEYGHVLGLPDFYDAPYSAGQTANKTEGPGKYDIMDVGSYNNYGTQPPGYSAYEKWLCNWLEYTDAENGTTYTLPALSDGNSATAVRIRIPRPGSTSTFLDEYFVVEARANESWDSTLPEHGIFIWGIDYNKTTWAANQVNTGGRQRYRMLPSSTRLTREFAWPGTDGDFGKSSYSGKSNALTPHAYSPKFVANLTNISYDPDTKQGSFEYNMVTETPELVTTLSQPKIVEGTNDLLIEWEPVEGATGYYVTMTRKNAVGSESVVDRLNNTYVGNVTSYRVRNISNAHKKETFKYDVRVEKYIPAKDTSAPLEFVFDNLETTSGVGSVSTDAATTIFGGAGFISAPENARIFTLNGIECGRDNLPAGIYLVRHNSRTSKVVVK